LLLPAMAVAVYLYVLPGGEGFDAAQSPLHDEICKRDGDRLAQIQAKPLLDEAVRFGSELRCLKLWPQVLAVLDSLNRTSESAGVPTPNGAAPDTMSAGEAAPPASSLPATEATSATSDDACKHDEDRLAKLRANPSLDEATRFESEFRCPKVWPQLEATLKAMASPSAPESETVSQNTRVGTNAPNEASPASDAAADADRRIAALEREKDALAAEVGRLERHQESPSPSLAGPPASPHPAIPAEQADLESGPALASLPDGMPARVVIRYLRNNADARGQAESLANALRKQGVEVADLRESAGAVRTELSFSYAPDEAGAQQAGRLAGIAPVRRSQPEDVLMVRPGTVELDLAGESHLAAITTSRRESTHE
jgi:hypothetical protein